MGLIFVRDKKFYKYAAAIALPIIAQNMITVGVNVMDNVMVGQLGEVSISAVSLANQFLHLYHVCTMGLSMGAAVLTARYFGAKDRLSLMKTVALMMRLSFLLATVFGLGTWLFPGAIMRMYTPDADIIREGSRFLLWSVPSYWLSGLSLSVTMVLRSVKKMHIPLYASIGSFFMNIFANYVFIFGKFGMPCMGAAGAALGTVLSRLLEFVVICGYFFLMDQGVGFRIRDLRTSSRGIRGEYFRVCIPVLISDTLYGFGNTAVAVVMGHIGKSFVSANAITGITQMLASNMVFGISQASCISIGHTLGAGDRERAQQEGVTFLAIGTLVGILAAGIIVIISPLVISLYNVTEETAALASELMDALAFMVVFQCTNNMLAKGVLRGGGDTRFLMVADILFLWVISIPVGAAAGLVWHWPGFWIFVALKLDQILKTVWCTMRLLSGKWIKTIRGAKVTETEGSTA